MKGTSLVAQWLGLHASNAGGMDRIPGPGTKIPRATWHGQKNHSRWWLLHETKRCLLLGRKAMKNLDSVFKSRDTSLPTKVHLMKAMVFPVVMCGCGLDHKEGWALKNWCFQTVVLEKTLESPLDSKQIKTASPKGNQLWIIGLMLKLQYFGPPDAKSQLNIKDPGAGKDCGQEEMGAWEDEMVGWHHRFNRHEFGQSAGDSEGQGSLLCCSPWGHKESDTTEWLNNNNKKLSSRVFEQRFKANEGIWG